MSTTDILESQPTQKKETDKLIFSYFPAFALFIKNNYLIPFIREQIKISKEIDLPLLRYFKDLNDEQLIAMSVESNTNFLTVVSENGLKAHLENSMRLWKEDALGILKQDEITAEDITLISYYRKKALMKFLPAYTTNVTEAIEIIKEIDEYAVESDTAASNLYIQLLKDRLNEQVHFAESIANTTPGLSFIYDLAERKLKYANKNYEDYFGHTLQELQEKGTDFIIPMIHPDDYEQHYSNLKKFTEATNKAIITSEYRLKDKNNNYKWMRNYTSVFRRNEEGLPAEIIGIIMDINAEQESAIQLERREEQLLEAQKQAQVGSFELDIETGKMDVTPQFREIYELENFDLYNLIENVHPDDRQRINENREKAITDGSLYDNEYRYLINGKEKTIRSRGRIILKNGRRVMTGTAMDVSARFKLVQDLKSAIELLQESDSLFKQAQALTHIGNWTWDIPANKVTWSDEMYRVYGLEPQSEEVNYETYISHIHPDDRETRKEQVQRVFETGEAEDHHYRIQLPDGTVRILHTKSELQTDSGGKPIRMTGTCQDITEKQTLIQKLQEQQDFIKKVMDVTPSIITAYNINTGKYSFVNEAIEKLLGYSPAMVAEKGVSFMSNLVHPDDLQNLMEKNAAALEEANRAIHHQSEPIADFKYRIQNKKGVYRWLHTFGTVFERDQAGRVESVLNISIDITDQEMAEQALYQKNLQLEQSNNSLEEYAYVASHDLREPLRKISTFSDRILTSQQALTDDGRTYLTKVIESSGRMQKMINDLLSVSTISGNKAFEPCDLNETLADALKALDHKIEEQKVLIEADDLPELTGVRSQFVQLFQNLVGNSLKFTRPGVQPVISIRYKKLDPKDADRFKLTKTKKYVKIEVSDNGIGFDNQYAHKIFAIFQRLHGKSEYEGTGIGLTICKRIVENHDGIIYATGISGEGATFHLVLPA